MHPAIPWTIPAISALACLALAAVGCGDGSSGDAEYEEYFSVMAPELLALEQDLTAITEAGQDLAGEALAANFEAYGDNLDAARLVFAEIKSPGDTEDPHARLIAASQALVDVSDLQAKAARGDPSVPSAEDLGAQGLSRASEWYAACHDLQDIALVRELDADMRCVTALGG